MKVREECMEVQEETVPQPKQNQHPTSLNVEASR